MRALRAIITEIPLGYDFCYNTEPRAVGLQVNDPAGIPVIVEASQFDLSRLVSSSQRRCPQRRHEFRSRIQIEVGLDLYSSYNFANYYKRTE